VSLYPPYTHEEIKARKTRLNAVCEYFHGKTDLKRVYSGKRICKNKCSECNSKNLAKFPCEGLCGKYALIRAVRPTEKGVHDSGCDVEVSTSEAKFLVPVVPARQLTSFFYLSLISQVDH
jgi:hypothetical protein